MGKRLFKSTVSAKRMVEAVMDTFKEGELASLRLYKDMKCLRINKQSITLIRSINGARKSTLFRYSEYGGETKTIKAVKEFRDREREEFNPNDLGIQGLSLGLDTNVKRVFLVSEIIHGKKAYGTYVPVKDMAELRVAVKKGMKVIEAIRGRKYYTKPDFDKMEPLLEQALSRVNGIMQVYRIQIGTANIHVRACGEKSALNIIKSAMKVDMVEPDVEGVPEIISIDIKK